MASKSRDRRLPVLVGGPIVDLEPMRPESAQPSGRAQPKISQHKKRRIFARDEYRCVICGSDKDLTIDHKVPWSKGGSNKDSNLQTLCNDCNQFKSDES